MMDLMTWMKYGIGCICIKSMDCDDFVTRECLIDKTYSQMRSVLEGFH